MKWKWNAPFAYKLTEMTISSKVSRNVSLFFFSFLQKLPILFIRICYLATSKQVEHLSWPYLVTIKHILFSSISSIVDALTLVSPGVFFLSNHSLSLPFGNSDKRCPNWFRQLIETIELFVSMFRLQTLYAEHNTAQHDRNCLHDIKLYEFDPHHTFSHLGNFNW